MNYWSAINLTIIARILKLCKNGQICNFYRQDWIVFLIVFIALFYRQLSADIKMKNDMVKTSFVSPEKKKSLANKTAIDITIFFVIVKIFCDTMLYMIFQYCWKPVLIQRISIGFEAVLETVLYINFLPIIKKTYRCWLLIIQ